MATILVADDQVDIRGLLEVTLTRRGHDVLLADSGTAALELAERRPIDLAILDVNMPGLEGTQVARALRARPATANIPILLLTALAGEADTLAGFAAGADDYVTKPFNPRELAARVQALLARGSTGTAPAARPQGRLIAVAGPKGGCGRTTVAVNIALALASTAGKGHLNGDVLLIDGHFGQGDLDIHLDLRGPRSMRDLVPYAGHLDVAAVQQALVPHSSGLKSLLGARGAGEAELITLSIWQEILSIATAIGEVVVVDLGPRLDDERCLATLDAASVVLLVTTPEIGAVRNARQLLEIAPRLGLDVARVRAVLNRTHGRIQLSAKDVASALTVDPRALVELPDDGPAGVERVNRGTPVVVSEPNSATARALGQLAQSLVAAGVAR
jgi:two-component system, OmpR family, response regulator MtrA